MQVCLQVPIDLSRLDSSFDDPDLNIVIYPALLLSVLPGMVLSKSALRHPRIPLFNVFRY